MTYLISVYSLYTKLETVSEAAVEDASIAGLLHSFQGLQTNLRKILDTTYARIDISKYTTLVSKRYHNTY